MTNGKEQNSKFRGAGNGAGDALVKQKKPVTGAITWMKTPFLQSWPLARKDVMTVAQI